ncbi:hypothetical protein N803_01340 [Knoellia subterranea KCTC 19937]|uniref:DUF742 domain-containing protein n=1 Tax=Knoellia subterranea KCTC 19937 TaxID=1385521 RepID=A0A0A0JR12_9MICO|nr:hypothetical protein N803_01340 [Knoellia subterranea KCTC 19937]
MVRPYALTLGRTRSSVNLPVEVMIQQLPLARRAQWAGHDQNARIIEACEERTSVAEIAAAVGLPLGVVRVLLGDLIEQGYLEVAAVVLSDSSTLTERKDLIERTLRGLRAI